ILAFTSVKTLIFSSDEKPKLGETLSIGFLFVDKYYYFRQRARCLLLANQGVKVEELMKIFQVIYKTIYNWFNPRTANLITLSFC
ncbi:MAG: hypothetical protein ACK44G_01685, partial [Aphanizomenon sp.]